jgi:hypothetical protein
MGTTKNTEINLAQYKSNKSSNFTGRDQGTSARKAIGLDALDRDEAVTVTLIIPSGTTSFNPSFYLGLLFDSFKKLTLKGFKNKYTFHIEAENPETKKVIESNLEDGMRNAINALGNKNALKEFIN